MKEVVAESITAFEERCKGMTPDELAREGGLLAEELAGFMPVAELAVAYRNAVMGLWTPEEAVWELQIRAFEEKLAVVRNRDMGGDAARLADELRAQGEVLRWCRGQFVAACGGKAGKRGPLALGVCMTCYTDAQKQAWSIWSRVSKVLDGITMRAVLAEGVYIVKKGEEGEGLSAILAKLGNLERGQAQIYGAVTKGNKRIHPLGPALMRAYEEVRRRCNEEDETAEYACQWVYDAMPEARGNWSLDRFKDGYGVWKSLVRRGEGPDADTFFEALSASDKMKNLRRKKK